MPLDNLSRRVTEKKRKRKTKNAFRNPLAASPRAPERPTPRALAMPKSLSSADVDRCARFAGRKKGGGGGGGGARVFFSLSSKSVSSFLMTQRQKWPPPSSGKVCKKCRLFFLFFSFFFFLKKRRALFFSLFSLFFLSFFLLLWMLFWTRGEDVFTELHFCDTREFCIAPRSNNPFFCFPTQHLQAHLQEEHQRARGGGSRCFGVVNESSERARGERALTSPVEGGDRERGRERHAYFFLLGICTEWNTCSLLPLGVFSQKHVVEEEEAKKPPQEEKTPTTTTTPTTTSTRVNSERRGNELWQIVTDHPDIFDTHVVPS